MAKITREGTKRGQLAQNRECFFKKIDCLFKKLWRWYFKIQRNERIEAVDYGEFV